jgi:hypothetical protein
MVNENNSNSCNQVQVKDNYKNITTSRNSVQTCLYEDDDAANNITEPLIELLLMSRESSLSNLLCTFEDFK